MYYDNECQIELAGLVINGLKNDITRVGLSIIKGY